MYKGQFTKDDFHNWIVHAKANFNNAKVNYEADQEYIENEQTPSTVTNDQTYVQENRLTPLVRRLAGQLISGGLETVLIGGGKKKEPVKRLFEDVFETIHFHDYHKETIATRFYGPGYGGIKWRYNARKLSKYGIGCPEMFVLKYNELLLDPNSKDPMHRDDMFRINPFRMLLSVAKKRWPDHAQEITESNDEYANANDTEKFCDVYEIEFMETLFINQVIPGSNKSITLEKDVWYIVKVVNETVVVEGPEETGYPICRLIPFLHTPREHKDYGGYPFGPVRLLGQTQDHYNVLISIMHEVVKKDIKRLAVFSGVSDTELADYDIEAAKTHGKLVLHNPGAKVDWAPNTGLAPSLIQLREMISHRFDSQVDQFSPSRGEVSGDLSGKAINLLQGQGMASEYVAQAHIETALTDLGICIYTCIKKELNTPFKIQTLIDGQEKDIYFNTKNVQVEGDDLNVVENGVVNSLEDIDMKVKVEVIMNTQIKQQIEIQKAQAAQSVQKISTTDYLKAFYPKTWQEKLANLLEENEALRLMQEMAELGPQFMQAMRQLMAQFKPQLAQLEEGQIR